MSDKRKRQILEGRVRKAASQKTITVVVPLVVKDAKYKKYLRRDCVLHVHDEKGQARAGDRVAVCATRPVSKTKHFRLIKVLERAKGS
jgi:small subunit ribosomal protein S17